MPLPTIDYYSKNGATKLAAMVTTYWTRRGVGHVVAEAYRIEGTTWGVTSNLVNGLPPAKVDRRGRHSNGKVKLTPRVARVEPEVAAARREFLG